MLWKRAVLPRGILARCAAALWLACAATAGAQIDPDDDGAGSKLGLTQGSNSGQVGTVLLLGRGRTATLVVVDLAGEPAGRSEPVRVERGHACERRRAELVFELAPVVNGASRTLVTASAGRLLSGNYVLAVYASAAPRAWRVACGQLYR